jgi:hypothetical protein
MRIRRRFQTPFDVHVTDIYDVGEAGRAMRIGRDEQEPAVDSRVVLEVHAFGR